MSDKGSRVGLAVRDLPPAGFSAEDQGGAQGAYDGLVAAGAAFMPNSRSP
jgi:hypothetical protein